MSDANQAVAAVPKSGLYVRARPGLVLRDAKVARAKRRLYIENPHLTKADDTIARRFCELGVIIEQVYAWIRTEGVMSPAGEVKNAVEAHRRLTLAQNTLATQLGLTPASRMAIRADGKHAVYDVTDTVAERVVEIGKGRAQTGGEAVDDGIRGRES